MSSGEPIDGTAVRRIVIGSTTRSDVFALLGAPHSLFQGQVEFREAMSVRYDRDLFFSHSENRYLTALDDRHYAMLYRFATSTGATAEMTLPVLVVRGTEVRIRTDELLLLLTKDSNIVEDFAYRKESK